MAYFKVKDVHWEIFLEYFQNHPDCASGSDNSTHGRRKYKELWAELTTRLNSAGYGEKSIEKWQKTWSDYKYGIRKKASEINNGKRLIGGDPKLKKKLTPIEIKLLDIIGETLYEDYSVIEELKFLEEKIENDDQCQEKNQDTSSSNQSNLSDQLFISKKRNIVEENGHDYIITSECATPVKKKARRNDDLMAMYKETVNAIKNIGNILDTRLKDINNSISEIKDVIKATPSKCCCKCNNK